MPKSTADYIQLAGLGVDLIVDAATKSTVDLIQIAGIVGLKDGHLTLKNCGTKSTVDLINIASVYPKNITFDFCTL